MSENVCEKSFAILVKLIFLKCLCFWIVSWIMILCFPRGLQLIAFCCFLCLECFLIFPYTWVWRLISFLLKLLSYSNIAITASCICCFTLTNTTNMQYLLTWIALDAMQCSTNIRPNYKFINHAGCAENRLACGVTPNYSSMSFWEAVTWSTNRRYKYQTFRANATGGNCVQNICLPYYCTVLKWIV